MPIFEYVCGDCHREYEELVRSDDRAARPPCPACGSRRTERKLSVFAARTAAEPRPREAGGPCGRCGDPSGPCGLS